MKTNMKKEDRCLRVGILGAGTISQAAHLPSSLRARNIELVALCDVAEDLLQQMALMFHPKRVYTDYEKMLKDEEIEAVIIGNGDQFHVPCALMAIEAGKHVLVEKPMGVSVEECETLAAAAKSKGLILQVGHMKRFDPGLQFVKRFIDEEIGKVTTYKGWYCDSTERYTLCDNVMPVLYSSTQMKKPAGNPKENKEVYYLLGHGSHLFDTAITMMGPIVSVQANHVQQDGVYSWLIQCDFESGAIGNLDLTVAIRAPWDEGVTIYGTNGTAYAKTYNPWELKTSEVQCYNETTRTMKAPYNEDGHVYRRQLEGFAEVILNGSPQIGANAEDGTQVIRALVATHQSVHHNGKRIYLKDVEGGL